MRDFIDKEKRSTIMETSKIERLRDMKKNDEKQQETAKEKMSRKKLLCVIGIPVGILVVIYLVLALFFQSHFAFRTTINNVGVSASSTSGVEKKITKQASRYEMKLVEREDKTESINGTDIDMEPVFDKQVKELLKKQNGFAWPYYLISPRKYEVETMISFDEEKLKDVLDNLSCMDEGKWTDSENAQIKDYTKDGYEVQPEVYGTKIDKDAFTEKIKEALDKMQPEFDLSGEGCYEDPKVKEEDDVFQDALDTLNKYTQMKITYQAEGRDDVVLDGETISTWLSVDDDFNVSVDDEALSSYVKAMAKNYNTAYGNRTLDTSYGQTVTIYGGNYGWWVDNAAEKEMILEDLKAGKDVKREPVYSQTANSHGENDYGNTYVEINLTAQHLFFYKNGSLVVESDFVSGNLAKNHGTPSGSFGVTYKAKDAVLRGEDYESPVSFWIPFNGGVGMHDASWRSTFGGTIYKRSGSHGCINLPYSAAKTIYENIEAGYPVLVYELPGTESQKGKDMDAASAVDEAITSIGTVTLDSAGTIASVRSQYDALSDSAKAYVKNLNVLTAAESALSQLQYEQALQELQNQESIDAQNVTNTIMALPDTITATDAAAVANARNAYNALSEGAKAKVPQSALDKLAAAEAAL